MVPSMNLLIETVIFEVFMCFLGISISIEVQKLPKQQMYWDLQDHGLFKSFIYSKLISIYRFEDILLHHKFSGTENEDDQIIDFLYTVSTNIYVTFEDVGVTTACCFRLTAPWQGTRLTAFGDSWFGFVFCVKELINKNELKANMLVTTAFKNY